MVPDQQQAVAAALRRGGRCTVGREGLRRRAAECTAGLRAQPNQSDLLAARGRVRLAMGQLDEATADLQKAVAKGPTGSSCATLGEALIRPARCSPRWTP